MRDLFFQRQDRRHRTGIQQGRRVNQEPRETKTGELRTVAAQYPDFHFGHTSSAEPPFPLRAGSIPFQYEHLMMLELSVHAGRSNPPSP